MEVFSTPYPETAWGVPPWIHSLFENPAAVASGIEAALKRQGRTEKVVCIGGRRVHARYRGALYQRRFERGHDITYICYDNEAYMNTGIQRSGATPYGASTTTSPAGSCSLGNPRPKKDMPAILAAHGAPYVATASIAYRTTSCRRSSGRSTPPAPATSRCTPPCCTGWGGFESGETLNMAKLAIETGLWVNYEMVDGRVEKAKKVRRKPVEEYLAKQKRFRHLFKPARRDDVIAQIQAIADSNAERFGIDIKRKESSE